MKYTFYSNCQISLTLQLADWLVFIIKKKKRQQGLQVYSPGGKARRAIDSWNKYLFIWEEKKRKTGELCCLKTIAISPLVA